MKTKLCLQNDEEKSFSMMYVEQEEGKGKKTDTHQLTRIVLHRSYWKQNEYISFETIDTLTFS